MTLKFEEKYCINSGQRSFNKTTEKSGNKTFIYNVNRSEQCSSQCSVMTRGH